MNKVSKVVWFTMTLVVGLILNFEESLISLNGLMNITTISTYSVSGLATVDLL